MTTICTFTLNAKLKKMESDTLNVYVLKFI